MTAKKITMNIASVGVLAALLLAGPAFAQTASTTDDTPGTPNTGSGGNAAANVILLTGSALTALGGVAALTRRRNV